MVNQLVQDLIDYNFQIRHNATREASGWLGKQLDDLRKQSEDLQAKVVELQRDAGVFTSGQADSQGREQAFAPALDRLQQATTQLEQAQSARIMKGALYQVVKDGDPELDLRTRRKRHAQWCVVERERAPSPCCRTCAERKHRPRPN